VIIAIMRILVKTHPVAGVTAMTECGNGHPGVQLVKMQTSLHTMCYLESSSYRHQNMSLSRSGPQDESSKQATILV